MVNHSSEHVTPTLVSVNVGMPADVPWRGRTVHTGIYKNPVTEPVMVRRLNIDGDGQGDLGGHGGEQRAVMVYQTESYDHWRRHFDRDDLVPGMFGENFTITGLGDDEVCVGDRYRIGEAEFEVTQPRVTCFRVGMRLGEPEMPNLLVAHHRPGFYFRVISEGRVTAGDVIERTRRGRHELTVAEIDALLYLPERDVDTLRKAVDIPALSPGWQQSFAELLAAHDGTAPRQRRRSESNRAGADSARCASSRPTSRARPSCRSSSSRRTELNCRLHDRASTSPSDSPTRGVPLRCAVIRCPAVYPAIGIASASSARNTDW